MTARVRWVGFAFVVIILCTNQVALSEFLRQEVRNDLDAGNDATGARIGFAVGFNSQGKKTDRTPKNVWIKDENGGNLVEVPRVADYKYRLKGSVGGINVTADFPAFPPADTTFADVYWEPNGSRNNIFIDSDPNDNTIYTNWESQQDNILGAIKLFKFHGKVDKLPDQSAASVSSAGNTAVVNFTNDDSVSVVCTNIRVYKNQPIGNYTIDSFESVTGSPVNLSDVTVSPGSTSPDVSIGAVDPNTYQYLIADCHMSSEPTLVLSFSVGKNLNEPDVVAPAVSTWGLITLGILVLVAGTLCVLRRDHRSRAS